jgi:tetratricopeptide (TPR) repeat protein
MKCGRTLVLLLALRFCGVCVAQENRPGPDPVVRATAQALRAGRVTDAEKILTDAIHEQEQSDPQSPRLADYLERLARVAQQLGRNSESDALMERAYEINRKAYGPTDLRITHDLISQAMSADAAGDTEKAERFFKQALEAVRANAALVNSHPGMGEGVVGPVVSFYVKERRWIEADALLPELTRLCGLIEEPYRTGFDPCGRLSELATKIHNAEGNTADLSRLPYEGDYPQELEALNKSARKFEADGLYPAAEDAFQRAIAAAERIEADPHNLRDGLVVVEMNSLGQLYEKERLKDRAEQTYLSSLRIQEKNADPELGHKGYAVTLGAGELVELYRRAGRLGDAESVLQQILDIQVKSLGERNRTAVQTMVRLAGIEEEEGKADAAYYAKALPLFERALAIQEANLGPDNPQLLNVLVPYADLLDKMHSSGTAAEVRARMARISPPQQNSPN